MWSAKVVTQGSGVNGQLLAIARHVMNVGFALGPHQGREY